MRSYLRESLAVILIVSGCGSGEADPDAGDWRFNADTVRSADGSVRQTSFLRVVGQEGPEGEPRTRPVILSFDCLPDNAGSTIMTDQALRQGSVETRLTVDSFPPLPLPAFAGTTPSGGQVVLTVPQDSLLALLSGHQRAVIEYADGAGSSRTTAEFRLTGLGVYQAAFQKACAERGG